MKLRPFFLFFVFPLFIQSISAATVDTVSTYSPSMKKNIKAVIVLPETYSSQNEFPVVYLLHGYSGNYADWIKRAPQLKDYADAYSMILVCPDGNYGSWYLDSPEDSSWKFETYVSQELISWVDKNYKTRKNKNGRAITGLSMGGHGAFYLAFRHQDVFGAAGSMSGGVDIRPFPNNWDLSKRLGQYSQYPERWEQNTVINLLYLLTPGSLSLIFDCGTEDFFYDVNLALHQKLMYRNIPHDFISRPGAHNWKYWVNAVGYQLQFMNSFFAQNP